ncbi:MAG: glycogen synthase GlgA [Terriglobia bacterium]
MRIVFVASECVPFSKTGGLADVIGALPKALAASGHDVVVLLPRYRITKPGPVLPSIKSLTVPLTFGAAAGGFKFAAVQDGEDADGVRHYLIDCPEFFDRPGLYGENGLDYPDNAERFAAFSLAALELMKRSATPPDVIHCHDWQASLAPVYLRTLYQRDPFFVRSSVLLTIHNLGYQGVFPPDVLPRLAIDRRLMVMDGLEFWGKVNLLKGGLFYSDFLSTVSPAYAREIQTKEFGHGLEGVLQKRSRRLTGILNGADYQAWNPATDVLLAANYTPQDLAGKLICKKALLEKMGAAEPRLERPVVGIISRFDKQKGFDLIADAAGELMAEDLYVAALGTGDPIYEEFFRTLAARYPERFLVKVAYDNALAHQIEAGSDIFLMPSRYEPCGLNQMYSLKYGAVPVVRATGGLDDSVRDFDGENGTGFKFDEYSAAALLVALRRALAVYRQPEAWRRLMANGMQQDFSWTVSAAQYASIYEDLRREKAGVLMA